METADIRDKYLLAKLHWKLLTKCNCKTDIQYLVLNKHLIPSGYQLYSRHLIKFTKYKEETYFIPPQQH